MKPADVKSKTYIESNKEINNKEINNKKNLKLVNCLLE